ncbi:hypothetical protein [Methanomethylophilus alvi]|uniref:hypothetical protein n=1 Tax=Methanomethylophilus alvi TaxID=1291540 RepID=UPI0037DCBA20
MGLGDKFKNIVDKTVDKIDDNITRAGEDDSEHIARYCKDLVIGDAVKEKALAILKDTDGKDISSGRNRAAACIYIAGKQCGEAKTLSDLAKCARTTEGLIRDKAKEVKDKLKIDVEIEEPSTEEEKKE